MDKIDFREGDQVIHLQADDSTIPGGTKGTVLAPLGKAPSTWDKLAVDYPTYPNFVGIGQCESGSYWRSRPEMLVLEKKAKRKRTRKPKFIDLLNQVYP